MTCTYLPMATPRSVGAHRGHPDVIRLSVPLAYTTVETFMPTVFLNHACDQDAARLSDQLPTRCLENCLKQNRCFPLDSPIRFAAVLLAKGSVTSAREVLTTPFDL